MRHMLEMTGAMMVSMMLGSAAFLAAGGWTLDEAIAHRPILFVLVQAAAMTVGMVGWMRVRGHAWRSCAEMAAAMALPAVPLVALRAAHVIGGNVCGLYCLLGLAAMVGLMLYRRDEYGGHAALSL